MRVTPRTGLWALLLLLFISIARTPVNAQGAVLNSDPDFDQFYTSGDGTSGAWKPFKLSNPGPIIWRAPTEGWPKGPSLWIYADAITFDGGVYQVVAVTPGHNYHFEVAWAVVRHGGMSVHDNSQLIREVGIDPQGGVNPASPNVQWSAEYTGSGKFAPELAIDQYALNDHVTLFLRAQNRYTDQRNEVFFDHAVMSENTGAPPIAVTLPTQAPVNSPAPTARPTAAAPSRTRVALAAATVTLAPSQTFTAASTASPTRTAQATGTPTDTDTPVPQAPDPLAASTADAGVTRLTLSLVAVACLAGGGGIVLLGLVAYLLKGR